jgi:hypothetical protein
LLEEAKRLGADIRLGQKIASINIKGTAICMKNGKVISGDVIIGADGMFALTEKVVSIFHGLT